MTEEEQKEAIDSMRRAQANMRLVLNRNEQLQRELEKCVGLTETVIKNHVPAAAFIKSYKAGEAKFVPAKDEFLAQLDSIRACL